MKPCNQVKFGRAYVITNTNAFYVDFQGYNDKKNAYIACQGNRSIIICKGSNVYKYER